MHHQRERAAERLVGDRSVRPQPRRARCGDRRGARRPGGCRRRARHARRQRRSQLRAAGASGRAARGAAARASAARGGLRADAPARQRRPRHRRRAAPERRGCVPETRQQLETVDEQIALTRHALAALLAEPPQRFDTLAPTSVDAASGGDSRSRSGRPRRPPRRHRRRALARRSRGRRGRRAAGPVLSQHQPDGVHRAVELRPRSPAARRQRAVRRRPGDPPADLRCRPPARRPARPHRRPRRRRRELQQHARRRDPRRRRPDQLDALGRAPAERAGRRRRPRPRRRSTWPRSAIAPASATTSPCSMPRATSSPSGA